MDAIDFSKPATQQLHRVLVDTYPRQELMIDRLERAGLPQSDIPFQPTLRLTWQAVLVAVHEASKLDTVLMANAPEIPGHAGY